MKYQFQYGSRIVNYQLRFSSRKTLGITIRPDSTIQVNAPDNTPLEKIEEKLKKKILWIIKQQSYFLTFEPSQPQRRYMSGESIYYLGRQYRLEVISSTKDEVKYKGRFITVAVKGDKNRAKELVKEWYKDHAKIKFNEIAEPLVEKFRKFNVKPSSIYIQEMHSRWGSCTPQGKIILNPDLIKVPKACIEYVIIHELCHLLHHHHNKSFFDLQTKLCPDWESRKLKLEKYGVLI
jgi:hypothetical protein